MESLEELLYHGNWPFSKEIELLKQLQQMRKKTDEKIINLTRDLRSLRYYPRKTETKQLKVSVYYSYIPPQVIEAPVETEGTSKEEIKEEAAVTVSPNQTPGRWTLKVEGEAAEPTSTKLNFSSYFRKVLIELDPRLYSEAIVEWNCFLKSHDTNQGFEISRQGQVSHTIKLKLIQNHSPEHFKVSEELQEVVGQYLGNASAYTKPDIVMAVWQYIKMKNLIKEDDYRVAVNDAKLKKIFLCDSIPFSSIIVALKHHITPVGSVDLQYQLPLDKACENELLEELNFDVDVGIEDDLIDAREEAMSSWEDLCHEQRKELNFLKKQEQEIIARLQKHCHKRAWMMEFTKDPCGFTADVQKSQQADQEILVAEQSHDPYHIPHPHQFQQPWAREMVSTLLQKHPTQK